MTCETKEILCGACRLPVKGPADAKPDDLITCPSCGISDKRENVIKEVQTFITELAQRHLQEQARQISRRNKFIQFTAKPIKQRSYRFITDHKF